MFKLKEIPSEDPPLSFELKRQLNELNCPIEPEINESSENWESRYNTITKMYEKRRLQIIQDEYLAKLVQNEEFLNELRFNQDFMETLNRGKFITKSTYK